MEVLNKRKGAIPKGAVLVDRTTKWGNPYVVGVDGSRDQCIDLYERWIMTQPMLLVQLDKLKGKDLVCWCAPLRCHADILMDLANRWVDWDVVIKLRKGIIEFDTRPTLLELRTAGINPAEFRMRSRRKW